MEKLSMSKGIRKRGLCRMRPRPSAALQLDLLKPAEVPPQRFVFSSYFCTLHFYFAISYGFKRTNKNNYEP